MKTEEKKDWKTDGIVGYYAFDMDSAGRLQRQMLITDKLDDKHFVLVMLSAIDGSPNISRIFTIDQIESFVLVHPQNYDFIFNDYMENGWRFGGNDGILPGIDDLPY